ncbi:hypothetical protein BC830DRAFT_1094547 [Chytriomyces sp. MP71]|nr:hypothetical protein BC830DRAFT_1094547 [Chytriomyces sp. MP71]
MALKKLDLTNSAAHRGDTSDTAGLLTSQSEGSAGWTTSQMEPLDAGSTQPPGSSPLDQTFSELSVSPHEHPAWHGKGSEAVVPRNTTIDETFRRGVSLHRMRSSMEVRFSPYAAEIGIILKKENNLVSYGIMQHAAVNAPAPSFPASLLPRAVMNSSPANSANWTKSLCIFWNSMLFMYPVKSCSSWKASIAFDKQGAGPYSCLTHTPESPIKIDQAEKPHAVLLLKMLSQYKQHSEDPTVLQIDGHMFIRGDSYAIGEKRVKDITWLLKLESVAEVKAWMAEFDDWKQYVYDLVKEDLEELDAEED